MATGASIREEYSISAARSGKIRVSRLVLTGWGAAPSATAGLKAWSDQGRMWGVFTYASANSGTLDLYRRSTAGSGDKVCTGTVANGIVTLSAANTSGITGSADVDEGTPGTNPSASATFDVIVNYCDETDVRNFYTQFASLLDGSSQWEDQLVRFEALFHLTKRMLDDWIIRDLYKPGAPDSMLKIDEWGRFMLAHLVEPRNLAVAQAYLCCHVAGLNRGPIGNDLSEASNYYKLAETAYKSARLVFDYERDLMPDDLQVSRVLQVRRA